MYMYMYMYIRKFRLNRCLNLFGALNMCSWILSHELAQGMPGWLNKTGKQQLRYHGCHKSVTIFAAKPV